MLCNEYDNKNAQSISSRPPDCSRSRVLMLSNFMIDSPEISFRAGPSASSTVGLHRHEIIVVNRIRRITIRHPGTHAPECPDKHRPCLGNWTCWAPFAGATKIYACIYCVVWHNSASGWPEDWYLARSSVHYPQHKDSALQQAHAQITRNARKSKVCSLSMACMTLPHVIL
jgi:hypothetical protein